ncbi:amino acid kinase family protein [Vulcanisaeta thermophila]|uniref:amino acid kinase family protein n=1 Tax=Vulcanisaeta thermophila TaxID=867917 RepID=UPI000A9BE764|nr:carbamate kinase [Vulcanisaeta thermophila]
MLAVIALGGNAFAMEGARVGDPREQIERVKLAAQDVADLIMLGLDVVVTHGNGPQVGLLAERLSDHLSLDMMGAATEGWMGYLLANALDNEFRQRGINRQPIVIITRTLIHENDPSFQNPTKYIGPIYDKPTSERLSRERNWVFKEDPRGGFRRVVPSPEPLSIIELNAIKLLLNNGYIPICVGGGGVPIVIKDNELEGVEAVIDKDIASQLLATLLKADMLIILTDVDYVYINYKKQMLSHC